MKRIFNIVAAILIGISGYAQQNAPFSQYIFNLMLINPAYVGTRQLISLNATYSTQWTGFKGAPNTQTVSAEGPINNNMGLGLHILNDQIGAQSQQNIFGSYSYILKFNKNWRLSLGLAAGISNFMLNGTKLTSDNSDDPAVNKTKQNMVKFDSKAGLFLYSKRFYFGYSVTDLFADVFKVRELFITKQVRHYYLTSGYVFDVGKDLKIKPSFMIREDFKALTDLDVNLFVLFKERFWLGATIRFGADIFNNIPLAKILQKRDALIFLTEWNITKSLRIGYAYTLTVSALKGYSGHDIEVGYTFPKKTDTKMRTPRYF